MIRSGMCTLWRNGSESLIILSINKRCRLNTSVPIAHSAKYCNLNSEACVENFSMLWIEDTHGTVI